MHDLSSSPQGLKENHKEWSPAIWDQPELYRDTTWSMVCQLDCTHINTMKCHPNGCQHSFCYACLYVYMKMESSRDISDMSLINTDNHQTHLSCPHCQQPFEVIVISNENNQILIPSVKVVDKEIFTALLKCVNLIAKTDKPFLIELACSNNIYWFKVIHPLPVMKSLISSPYAVMLLYIYAEKLYDELSKMDKVFQSILSYRLECAQKIMSLEMIAPQIESVIDLHDVLVTDI